MTVDSSTFNDCALIFSAIDGFLSSYVLDSLFDFFADHDVLAFKSKSLLLNTVFSSLERFIPSMFTANSHKQAITFSNRLFQTKKKVMLPASVASYAINMRFLVQYKISSFTL